MIPPLPTALARDLARRIAASAILLFARLVTAPQAIWAGVAPDATQRVWFANHSSHADLVLMWAALPTPLRRRVRPVAAADYWLASRLRRFVGCSVFRALLIDRDARARGTDPIAAMAGALDDGDSLILFPEGTRNTSAQPLQPFRGGLYRLAAARPDVELVPVWIANLNRVLPKGEFVPVPLLCRLTFGAPLKLRADEAGPDFLARAEAALLSLAPASPASQAPQSAQAPQSSSAPQSPLAKDSTSGSVSGR